MLQKIKGFFVALLVAIFTWIEKKSGTVVKKLAPPKVVKRTPNLDRRCRAEIVKESPRKSVKSATKKKVAKKRK